MFFSLSASYGFLLAGGAALAAQKLTSRPTQDLDFFTGPNSGDVLAARDAIEAAALGRDWSVRRVRDTATFCRIVVTSQEDLLVDLALDAPPNLPPTASAVGPTFDPEELAGRKVIALFDRAEARDFTDVYVLAHRYPKTLLLARAAEVDLGFDLHVFGDMLGTWVRCRDSPTRNCRSTPVKSVHYTGSSPSGLRNCARSRSGRASSAGGRPSGRSDDGLTVGLAPEKEHR
jgi:hypothetical protein